MIPSYSSQILKNFIVFEGMDGAGSTTHAQLLVKHLHRQGIKAVLTAEPTHGPIGNLIRQILRGRLNAGRTREETDRQLAHLFAADRFDHLYNATDGVLKILEDGFTVVSTRYYFSSYAYNAVSEEGFDLVDRLNQDFPLPELVVYLTVPTEVSVQRLNNRELRELYEEEGKLTRVAENYQRIFAPIRSRVLEYVSQGDLQELARKIATDVEGRL